MNERIEKKMNQIAKIEKKIEKYGAELTEEQKENATKGNYKEFTTWCRNNVAYSLQIKMEDFRRASSELKDAKGQLEKIIRQEEISKAKEDTLNDMPEAMKEFRERVLKAWNEHDIRVREFFRKKYQEMGYTEFIKEYKYGAYEHMKTTNEEFERANKRAIDNLIINLLNRVIEKTGKITDASGLEVTYGNNNYPVINGYIIGENGNCRVESIGAGGYNIQKYHIRTLVK